MRTRRKRRKRVCDLASVLDSTFSAFQNSPVLVSYLPYLPYLPYLTLRNKRSGPYSGQYSKTCANLILYWVPDRERFDTGYIERKYLSTRLHHVLPHTSHTSHHTSMPFAITLYAIDVGNLSFASNEQSSLTRARPRILSDYRPFQSDLLFP